MKNKYVLLKNKGALLYYDITPYTLGIWVDNEVHTSFTGMLYIIICWGVNKHATSKAYPHPDDVFIIESIKDLISYSKSFAF